MDRLALGLQTTVIGMMVVFVALYILSVLMDGLKLLTGRQLPRVRAQSPETAEGKLPAGERPPEEEELAAVITAALAAYLDRPAQGLRIAGLKAVSPDEAAAGIWPVAGRLRQVESRLSLYRRRR